MQNVLIIHEKDHQDNDCLVIGVATSTENAQKLIDEYYGGKQKQLSFTDITDHKNETYKVTVWLEWFAVDSL